MAFGIAGMSDLDEAATGTHFTDCGAPGVAHTRPKTTGQLVDNLRHRPLERHSSFDAFRDEFAWVTLPFLEIPILRTVLHRAQRSHTAITFIGSALKQLDFSRGLLGSRQQPPDHNRVGASGNSFSNVSGKTDAAVSDHRDPTIPKRRGCIRDCGNLRNADTRDHPGSTNGPRTNTNLDGVSACICESKGRVSRCDISCYDFNIS